MPLSTILVLSISVLTASVAQIFLKKGVLTLDPFSFSFSGFIYLISQFFKNAWLLGGALLFIISFFFYLFVLSKLKLNFAYPVMVSAGIVLVTAGAWFFFKEQLSWYQIIGIFLIILGIIFLFLRK